MYLQKNILQRQKKLLAFLW